MAIENTDVEKKRLGLLATWSDRMSSPARFERQWSVLERKTSAALVLAALRQKDSGKLVSAIGLFGGVPRDAVGEDGIELLRASAQDPAAFGFGELLDAKCAAQSESSLAKWLRSGLRSGWWEEKTFMASQAARDSLDHEMPLAACFAEDNPRALACILSRPAMFESLATAEPKAMAIREDISELSRDAKRKLVRDSNADLESSLICQAVESGAYRCAGLLAAIPEFGWPALTPGQLGESATRATRCEQKVFGEAEGHVERCLFEDAAAQWDSLDSVPHGKREGRQEGWHAMIASFVDNAPERALSWRQKGTGMGWAEMYFARLRPFQSSESAKRGNEYAAKRLDEAFSVLARMEAKGFEIQWTTMAQACGAGNLMGEWLDMRAAAQLSKGMRVVQSEKIKSKSL